MKYITDPERILLKKFNAIYFPIPKVACSSIKLTLGKILQIKIERKEIVHNKMPRVYIDDMVDLEKYFKFGFVREPISRLYSCYKSKIPVRIPHMRVNG